MLVLGVALLVAVDLTILITYTIVEGIRGQLGPKRAENAEDPMDMTGVSAHAYSFRLNPEFLLLVRSYRGKRRIMATL